MPLNLISAFNFVFKEKNWAINLIIGSLLIFGVKVVDLAMDVLHSDALPGFGQQIFMNSPMKASILLFVLFMLSIILVGLAVWMLSVSFGYILTTIRRYMRSEEDIIPAWDDIMGKLFRRGFRSFFAIVLFILGIGILGVGAQMVGAYLLTVSPMWAMIVGLVAAFVIAYTLFALPALLISYCEKDRFLASFDFVRARQIILKSIKKYFIMWLMLFIVTALTVVIVLLFFRMTIGIVVLPFLCFYLMLVKGNIIAQYYVNCCKE